MKDWKESIVTALEKEAVNYKEVSIYKVAKSLGYNHIKTQDVMDIIHTFCKRNPDYRPVKMLDYVGQNVSLFTNGYLTSLEYDDGKEYEIAPVYDESAWNDEDGEFQDADGRTIDGIIDYEVL